MTSIIQCFAGGAHCCATGDLGMPGMDGFEVARAIRRDPDFSAVMLIALTGWDQEHDVQRAREAGFDHHLEKPADSDRTVQLLIDS